MRFKMGFGIPKGPSLGQISKGSTIRGALVYWALYCQLVQIRHNTVLPEAFANPAQLLIP